LVKSNIRSLKIVLKDWKINIENEKISIKDYELAIIIDKFSQKYLSTIKSNKTPKIITTIFEPTFLEIKVISRLIQEDQATKIVALNLNTL